MRIVELLMYSSEATRTLLSYKVAIKIMGPGRQNFVAIRYRGTCWVTVSQHLDQVVEKYPVVGSVCLDDPSPVSLVEEPWGSVGWLGFPAGAAQISPIAKTAQRYVAMGKRRG